MNVFAVTLKSDSGFCTLSAATRLWVYRPLKLGVGTLVGGTCLTAFAGRSYSLLCISLNPFHPLRQALRCVNHANVYIY